MEKAILFLVSVFLTTAVSYGQNAPSKAAKEYDSLVSHMIYGKNEKVGKYYTIRGFKMYCETYGSGEPLLFIHGNGSSISAFVKQIPFFSKKYKVIVADSRAHGKSIDKSDALTYEMMADDYAALLTEMKIDSAYVVGWSDGGINGLLLATRHPEKVKKLAITGANLQPDSTAISPDILKSTRKTYNMLKEKKTKNSLDSTVYKYMKLLIEQPHIAINDLHKIKVPTLVIGGDQDVIRPSHTLTIFENIPNANLWILPNSGHSTLVRYSEEFNAKVDAFLKTKYHKIEGGDRGF